MAGAEQGGGVRRAPRLVMPEVVGLHWENARARLQSGGFNRSRIQFTESYEPEDSVVAQSPSKGQLASSETEVVLCVSKPSLIRFLPSIFQSAGTGTDPDFVRRLLWVFHHFFDDLNRKVDGIHRQFSPDTADEEFLPWLAQWIAVTLDADWPARKKRRMLRSAARLYNRRGTAPAIRRLLQIFTEVEPEIVENSWPYNGFWVGVHSTIGVDTVVLPPVNLAHCFVVRFPRTYEELGEATVGRIHQIIRAEKPAHAVYYLQFADDPREA